MRRAVFRATSPSTKRRESDGPAWFDFVKSCRVTLGSESGSNVFDFDGSIMALYKQMKAADPHLSYDKFHPLIAQREKEIDMAQISPRMFEAAAMRTAMVLFRGRYSGLIEPDIHYIPLETDYSNLDDVLDRVQDVPALEAMTERAYRDLIASGAYGYRAFVNRMDDLIEAEMRKPLQAKPDVTIAPMNTSLVTSTPLGHDAYLLGEVERLRAQVRGVSAMYEKQERRLTAAYHDSDRLLEEVRSYGDALNRVAEQMRGLEIKAGLIEEQKSRLEEQKSRLEEENSQLRLDLESIRALAKGLSRAICRRLILAMRGIAHRARMSGIGLRLCGIPRQPKAD